MRIKTMKYGDYQVTIIGSSIDDGIYHGLTKNLAVSVAKHEAEKTKSEADVGIFVSFIRPSDGKKVYLNPTNGFDYASESWATSEQKSIKEVAA
jgi:hypothetical protein